MRPAGSPARFPLAVVVLLGSAALSCATSLSEGEPQQPRPAEVVGLAPLSEPNASSPHAPGAATASANGPTDALNGGESPPDPSTPPEGETCTARLGARAVRRAALSRALDAGLGTWLKGVDVEAKIDRGHFQGWLVRTIYAGDPCWTDIDLRAGDIVTRVNRHSVERPEEAQVVWTALRTTNEIVIDYLRAGKPRTLRFAVVDAPE